MEYKDYRRYLNSSRWKRKKNSLRGLGCRCRVCEKKTKVHAHHLTYKRLGDENIHTDLWFLCPYHHKEIHDYADEKGMNIYNIYNASHSYKAQYDKRNRKKKKNRWSKDKVHRYFMYAREGKRLF